MNSVEQATATSVEKHLDQEEQHGCLFQGKAGALKGELCSGEGQCSQRLISLMAKSPLQVRQSLNKTLS